MFGDEVEDLRLDLSGFNTPLGDLVSGGEWRGKETGVGGGGEEEPSSSLKWKVGLVRLVGSAPREVNAPERTGCIVGMQNTKREIGSYNIMYQFLLPYREGSLPSFLLTPLYVNRQVILSGIHSFYYILSNNV